MFELLSTHQVHRILLFLIWSISPGLCFSLQAQATWPTQEWDRSTLEEQGLNETLLNQVAINQRDSGKYPHLHSLIVIKNGYLVFEEYFNDFNADRRNLIQSVTKSFTSAIVGIAIEQGHIRDVHEKVLDFYPDTLTLENLDDRKRSLTIEDILTMRTGTDYHENGPDSPHFRLNRLQKGWDIFYLNRPIVRDPGSGFQYDSGGVILLSALLKNRTGFHVDTYAAKYLFPHLGLDDVVWMKNNDGHPHTGGGLLLRPLEMAKFGLLYLREGQWEEQQLIPKDWVKACFTKHHSFKAQTGSRTTDYGYLWWILESDPGGDYKHPIYAARGYGGQNIFVIPEHDMVVVTTSNWAIPDGSRDPVKILYNNILPAVER